MLKWEHSEFRLPSPCFKGTGRITPAVYDALRWCKKLKNFVLHAVEVDFHSLLLSLSPSIEIIVFNRCTINVSDALKQAPGLEQKRLPILKVLRFVNKNQMQVSIEIRVFMCRIILPQVLVPPLDHKKSIVQLCRRHFINRNDVYWTISSAMDLEIDALMSRFYFAQEL